MNRRIILSATALVASLAALPAFAATPDHLQCFKISDATTAATYHADLTPTDPTFAPAPGCTVKVPAALLCVDAVKSNVTPPPPGSPDGIPAQKYLCYKTKCPVVHPTATEGDQFGTHAVTVKKTGLLCAPVAAPAASCTDGMKNGSETDVDCGGGTCPACANGLQCDAASDCTSNLCLMGVCSVPAPSCTDGMQNGSETDVDCGGGTCPPCAVGNMCAAMSDCSTHSCSAGHCVMATCSDAIQNGNETAVDCGGGSCPPCGTGQPCLVPADCISNNCMGNLCQ